MAVLHLNKENFDTVLSTDKRVLLDFFATWCGPCRMVAPVIEEIANENPQYIVAKIDVDEQPELASRFGVMSIPTLIVMKNGEVISSAVGAKQKSAIISMLEG